MNACDIQIPPEKVYYRSVLFLGGFLNSSEEVLKIFGRLKNLKNPTVQLIIKFTPLKLIISPEKMMFCTILSWMGGVDLR